MVVQRLRGRRKLKSKSLTESDITNAFESTHGWGNYAPANLTIIFDAENELSVPTLSSTSSESDATFIWSVDEDATSYKFYANNHYSIAFGGSPELITEIDVATADYLERDGSNYKFSISRVTYETAFLNMLNDYKSSGYSTDDAQFVWYVVPCKDGLTSPTVDVTNTVKIHRKRSL